MDYVDTGSTYGKNAVQRNAGCYDIEVGDNSQTGRVTQSMYRPRGPRFRSDVRQNAMRFCTPFFFVALLVATPFYVYMIYELTRPGTVPESRAETPTARNDAPRVTSSIHRLNQANMVWHAVDILVPDDEASNVMRFPAVGGYDGISTTNIVRSYMQCLRHSNELVEVGGGTPEEEHFHYVIREHRQSGRMFLELHRGDEQFSELVWCKFYVLTTAVGVT